MADVAAGVRRVAGVVGPVARGALVWLRPDPTTPTTVYSTVAWLDAFSPSLMPRTSALQGLVAGASVLASRGVTGRVERRLAPLLGPAADLPRRLAVRAVVGGVGAALGTVPAGPDGTAWPASARAVGTVLRSIAVGGSIHDVGTVAWARRPARGVVPAVAVAASVLAGVGVWADRRRRQHLAGVTPWPLEQRNDLPAAVATSALVVVSGRLVGEAFGVTEALLRRWFGPRRDHHVAAAIVNAGVWAGLGTLAYHRGVALVGRSNSLVETAYEEAPSTPLVSGGPGSRVDHRVLGRQGRRFVGEVLTPERIDGVLGEEGALQPIRVYVGFAAEPLYPTERAEQALEELERTGAYDRRYLLLVSPTGTGWVDESLVESAELFARGDIATCAIQYGMFPSFLAVQKVALGRSQFRVLLLGVRERLRGIPADRRPTVLVAGESLGAWTSSDVVMHSGISGFDHYGISRALWIGLPGLAKWSRSGMLRGSSALVPPGSVAVVDSAAAMPASAAASSTDPMDELRAVVLSHDNDPVALLSPTILFRPPRWLGRGRRGRGVPAAMGWTPIVTFLQVIGDALNSFIQVPGAFTSNGHDYRADMARMVHRALGLPSVTASQMVEVERALIALDLERAARQGRLG